MFSDARMQLYVWSLKSNRQFKPSHSFFITDDILPKIVYIYHQLPHAQIFVSLYTFAFFSFLRISSILSHLFIAFDITRHLCNVIQSSSVMSFNQVQLCYLNGQKHYRTGRKPELLLTQLWGAALYPVAAMKAMFNTNPLRSNGPLFLIRHAGRTTTLTDSMARKHVELVGTKLHHPAHLTFHMFIKGGVSWAFQHGVPLQDIMLHGTWSSNAVRRYIREVANNVS